MEIRNNERDDVMELRELNQLLLAEVQQERAQNLIAVINDPLGQNQQQQQIIPQLAPNRRQKIGHPRGQPVPIKTKINYSHYFIQIATSTICYPLYLIYYRKFLHVGSRQYYGIIDLADSILENQGCKALWAGNSLNLAIDIVFSQFMTYVTPQSSIKKLLGNLLQKIIRNSLYHLVLQMRIDEGGVKFDKSITKIFNNAMESEGKWYIWQGIVLMSLFQFTKQLFTNKIQKKTKNDRKNFLIMLFSSLLFIPITVICTRMQVEKCSFMQVLRKGNFYEGWGIFTVAKYIRSYLPAILKKMI